MASPSHSATTTCSERSAVVVAGGTGFLGTPLVSQLRTSGNEVFVLTRRSAGPGQITWSPDGTTGPWAEAVDGADAVINLAGELTEESAPGDDFLAAVCRDWEAEAFHAVGATRLVLLRTGLPLARNGGALPRIALPFRLLAGGPLGSGRQYWSWIHRDDWLAMTIWALHTSRVSGALNLTAPAPVTNREFAVTLGRVLKRPAFMPTPAFALRLLVGEMGDALLLAGQRVIPVKAEALGFRFRYTALEPALVAAWRR